MSRTSNICTAALEGQTIPPDGYIMIGAMWGDVGNWYMASIDECGFNTHPGFQGVRRTAPGQLLQQHRKAYLRGEIK